MFTRSILICLTALVVAVHGGCPRLCSKKNLEQYSAQQIIDELDLTINEHNSHYRRNFLDAATTNNRSVSSAIYSLVEHGRVPQWYQVDATQIIHYYGGAPASYYLSEDDGQPPRHVILGLDIFSGQVLQLVVEPYEWLSAQSHGKWTLTGGTSKYDVSETHA
ncbi:RmlC-like cupin domain-containing protein [Stachybotrys elegans]|uniref:RmlC-like cupin domain-containing protein n=1 Tax=Stachybotrys elegans TaxID=80388 RepID=A0A8K0SI36_9HYPO|nr:RmlC-like cupin domain-containing protein [Stachybotrys elegans]